MKKLTDKAKIRITLLFLTFFNIPCMLFTCCYSYWGNWPVVITLGAVYAFINIVIFNVLSCKYYNDIDDGPYSDPLYRNLIFLVFGIIDCHFKFGATIVFFTYLVFQNIFDIIFIPLTLPLYRENFKRNNSNLFI